MKIHPHFFPPHRKGVGVRTPPSKIAPKMACRYNKRNYLRAVLHGRDVSNCLLAIGGITDEDVEKKPAPVQVKIEGSERGKE